MMSIEEFKKTLPHPENHTAEEIEKLRNHLDKFADIMFDMWLRKRNSRNEELPVDK